MEGEVHIRCRESDYGLIMEIQAQACDEYKQLMKKEVKLFRDKEVPLKLIVDNNKFLPEYEETDGAESCMGGVLLHARKGRIVCTNTIDERLQLVYQEAIPDIRRILFPSFIKKKEDQPAEVVVPKHH